MTNNAELKLLCESLVANEFVLIHDAEQALELFERLTTPGLVLGLLDAAIDAYTDDHPAEARHANEA